MIGEFSSSISELLYYYKIASYYLTDSTPYLCDKNPMIGMNDIFTLFAPWFVIKDFYENYLNFIFSVFDLEKFGIFIETFSALIFLAASVCKIFAAGIILLTSLICFPLQNILYSYVFMFSMAEFKIFLDGLWRIDIIF